MIDVLIVGLGGIAVVLLLVGCVVALLDAWQSTHDDL